MQVCGEGLRGLVVAGAVFVRGADLEAVAGGAAVADAEHDGCGRVAGAAGEVEEEHLPGDDADGGEEADAAGRGVQDLGFPAFSGPAADIEFDECDAPCGFSTQPLAVFVGGLFVVEAELGEEFGCHHRVDDGAFGL